MFRQLCNIHGTIYFTAQEEDIIRHPEFNRLVEVKQLGYAYKGAFKGATHTRLSHSLGVCHLAKSILKATITKTRKFIENGRGNRELYPKDDELKELEEFENILGITALLHDINHTPFAHTIQSHLALVGNIIQSERNFEDKIDLFDCDFFDTELKEIVKNILVKSRHNKFKYGKLFYDIIRGDLGASSIDFIARDHFKSGFGRLDLDSPDERFVLIKRNGKVEIALDLTVNNFPFTMVYYLLFNRYKLAQRVYFHKTCASAEAMVGKALRRILTLQEMNGGEDLMLEFLKENQADYKFMAGLEEHPDPLVKEIGKRLYTRQIYDDAYTMVFSSKNELMRQYLCHYYRGKENHKNCTDLEKAIAAAVGIPEKEIIIFCYNNQMYGFDIKNFLVLGRTFEVNQIDNLSRDDYIESDSIIHLKTLHKKLWKFYVFCGVKKNYKKDKELLEKIRLLCEKIFKGKDELKMFLESSIDAQKTELIKATNLQKVFISYSTKDKATAELFYNKLCEWGIDTFIDFKKKPGTTIPKALNEQLDKCDLMILLWSKHSMKSNWVEKELHYWVDNDKKMLIYGLDRSPRSILIANLEVLPYKNNPEFWTDVKEKINLI